MDGLRRASPHGYLRKNPLGAYSNRRTFGRSICPHVRPCELSFLRTALVSVRRAIGIHAGLLPVRFLGRATCRCKLRLARSALVGVVSITTGIRRIDVADRFADGLITQLANAA